MQDREQGTDHRKVSASVGDREQGTDHRKV